MIRIIKREKKQLKKEKKEEKLGKMTIKGYNKNIDTPRRSV